MLTHETTSMNHQDFVARLMGELTSLTVIFGSFTALLPTVAVLLGIVWYCINIYEWYSKKKTAHKKAVSLPELIEAVGLDDKSTD
jgi:hypothetical protein